MGTRSQTVVKTTQNERYLTMYRQMDGYPSGHGRDLADFIRSGTFVNGYNIAEARQFNGVGCFAAQMVAHFKQGVGNFYLQPEGAELYVEDYTYEIVYDEEKYNTSPTSAKNPSDMIGIIVHSYNERVFFGSLNEFEAFITLGD